MLLAIKEKSVTNRNNHSIIRSRNWSTFNWNYVKRKLGDPELFAQRKRRRKMVQSLNREVDYTVAATSYLGMANYGKVMIGDKAFEFYNEKNLKDYIQIPWEEIDYVMASVNFKGKWIPRFAIVTKQNGRFTFSTRNNKATLRAINKYIESNRLVKSLSFFQVIARGLKRLFRIKS